MFKHIGYNRSSVTKRLFNRPSQHKSLSVMGYLKRAGLLDPRFAIHLNWERNKHLYLDRLTLSNPPCPRKSNLKCSQMSCSCNANHFKHLVMD
uniref:Uncharacterized protein n=1 Tax=Arundo donax TaxID=35708 RepID=A0A0A9D5B7_ARUDO